MYSNTDIAKVERQDSRTGDDVVIFCHGVPGSSRDASILGSFGPAKAIISPNLMAGNSSSICQDALDCFDAETSGIYNGKVHLVGFSIGSMVAIHIASVRRHRISSLTLISPAAPLPLGNFLPDMAGRMVFVLAMNYPIVLQILVAAQGLLSRIAPRLLIRLLFAGCSKTEAELLNDPSFLTTLADGFQNCYKTHPARFIQLIKQYTEDWSNDLDHINCPVIIWHGDRDTWSPVAMAYKLHEVFGDKSAINIVKGAGHYSTLRMAIISDTLGCEGSI